MYQQALENAANSANENVSNNNEIKNKMLFRLTVHLLLVLRID